MASHAFRHSAGISPHFADLNRRNGVRMGGFYSAIPPFPIGGGLKTPPFWPDKTRRQGPSRRPRSHAIAN